RTTGELRSLVNCASLERSGAEYPNVVRRAFLADQAGLPNRCSRRAVIGKNGNFGDAPLVLTLRDGNFRDGRRRWLHYRNLGYVRRRNTEKQIVAIGADRAGPRLNDEIRIIALVAKLTSTGQ